MTTTRVHLGGIDVVGCLIKALNIRNGIVDLTTDVMCVDPGHTMQEIVPRDLETMITGQSSVTLHLINITIKWDLANQITDNDVICMRCRF